MAHRSRYLANQLGKKISDPTAAAAGLIRRRNSKNEKPEIKGNRKGSLLDKYNPPTMDFFSGRK